MAPQLSVSRPTGHSMSGRLGSAILSLLLLAGQSTAAAEATTTTTTTATTTQAKSPPRTLQYYDDYTPALETCDDLIVQVSGIYTVCDSPQTYYYGSGVNRNSKTCNFGDKATTTVYFDVTEDLDTSIYVVMSVYAGYGNDILTSTTPKNLKKYVGYSCKSAGSYSFTYSTTMGSASSSSNYGAFIPFTQVAFSSDTNGDYNLGAANIPCQWDNREFGEWTEVTAKSSQFTSQDFLMEYGILISTVAFCLSFVAIFARVTQLRHKRVKELHNQKVVHDRSSALMPQDAESP